MHQDMLSRNLLNVRKIFIFIIIICLVAALPLALPAANLVDVTAYTYEDTLGNGMPNAFQVSIENDYILGGMSLGFKVWSPDGATWTWDAVPGGLGTQTQCVELIGTSRMGDGSVFDMTGFLVTEHDVDETGVDIIMCGGVAMMVGLPVGPLEHMYSMRFTPYANIGLSTICIDSTFVPPSAAFVFVDMGGGANHPATLWPDGGRCWPVSGHGHCWAEWDEALPEEMTVSKCGSNSVTLSASHPLMPVDFYLYRLSGGLGTATVIDNGDGTCEVIYEPVPEDVGQAISIEIDADCDGCPSSQSLYELTVIVTNSSPSIDCGSYYLWGATNNLMTKDDILAVDGDDCDEIEYFIITGPGEIDPVSGVYTWMPGPSDIGEYMVTVGATDDLDTAQGSFQAGVLDESCCPGDVNFTGDVNVGDAVSLLNYIFKGGPAPRVMNWADANADCTVNVGDVVYLIGYIFRSGPAPQLGCYY